MKDMTMEQLWDEAARRFEDRTRQGLHPKPPITLDDVRQQIESRPESATDVDDVSSIKHKKEIGLNILECLRVLGGIAAQGASVVFQPASIVFNAMSILLEAPKKIHEFHKDIDALFAIVAPSLGQFRIYEMIERFRKIDSELTRTIYITMISLVDICSLVISLQDPGSKWTKFKSGVKKALLDDDSGLSVELKKFENAISGQHSVEGTLTLEAALASRHEVSIILAKVFETGKGTEDISSRITTLQQAENKRTQDTTKKSYLSKIKEKFAIDDKALQAHAEIFKRLCDSRVENSGSWLDHEELYTSWADADDATAPPLLSLVELQEQLLPQNIEELNELLIWVIHGVEWFHVCELEAALFLRFRTTPLQKLRKKLEGKYSRLFDSDGSVITVRRDFLRLVKKESKQLQSPDDDIPRITATISITKADVTTVQNFLWALFQKSVVEKFEFEPLSGQISRAKGDIGVNSFDAHLAIVMHALNFIISKPDEKTESIGRYLVWHLPDHLALLDDPTGATRVDKITKRDIGSMLFEILGQGTIIKRHWEHFINVPWFENMQQISTLLTWLKDPDVTGHFGLYQMDWLEKVISSPSPHRAILFSMAREVGHTWVKSRGLDPYEAFGLLRQYLSLEVSDEGAHGLGDLIVILSTDDDAEALGKAEQWCITVLHVSEEQSLWHERIGVTARIMEEYEHAIAKFLDAIKLPDASWTCHEGLAYSYYKSGRVKDACASMEKAFDILSATEDSVSNDLWSINMVLGKWYFELKQPEQAIFYYEKALAARPSDDETNYRILEVHLTTQSQDRTLELIESMSNDWSNKNGISRLGSVFLLVAKDDETYDTCFTNIVSLAASRDGMLRTVLKDEEPLTSAVRLWEVCHTDVREIIEETGTYVEWKWMLLGGRIISDILYHYFKEATATDTKPTALDKLR
ncbi:Nacht and tpr domain protein [Fusarium beomiforme]|uniref:Nacht and tpr domain protein n=1 Tax=Fusarium beomiforme TaxID=44412 RepID=A0A9P5ANJ2_9HYPO|nr:Nacht and tpr domain protein [Fusarium beomiforme]